ncbi:phosphatidylinositol-specific phospholipase C [Pedobacter cryoconitis]|uniref:1-phosphatidylinositol phosphodiesterase n=1 Tax=Pedobacter cryoconitis TaxID=188932 RepID=A0A7X0MM89_9SPHI|nr:phosphatidylinositol-specific phospholipase C [Pedobacter cryoconitis]MBB6502218.1 1-phosphatidylinositol phosphodiesterase [Pedobacter cryoconitis]
MANKNLRFIVMAFGVLALSACKKQEFAGNTAPAMRTESMMTRQTALQNYTLSNWMSFLPDTTNLAQLSIPGTHDSGARIEPVTGTAKCQNLSIADQLTAGARFLDIRCRHINNTFAIHHDLVYQNLNFTDVLKACTDFLTANPTETIIMSVKEEYTPTGNTRSFEDTFDAYVQENAGKWDLGTGISKLADVRGKIKLLRRFGATKAKGIDATQWADNTTFEINNAAANLKIEDEYKVPDVSAKWTKMKALMDNAHSDSSNRLYISYGSGYKPLIFGIPDILTVNNYINPKVTDYFTANKVGKYGVVPLDFINKDISKVIVETNFGPAL